MQKYLVLISGEFFGYLLKFDYICKIVGNGSKV